MNRTFATETSDVGTRSHNCFSASALATRFAALIFAAALCGGLVGCGFLKPAQPTTRHFVLTSIPAATSASATAKSLPIGLGPVKMPAYLFEMPVAVRKGTNEVDYLPSALWAERLDAGFQRVLAADLIIVLPTDQVRTSAWQKDDVAAEVYINVEQFDVDASGRGILVARWRILSPGGEKVVKAGVSRLSRQGSSPDANASGAVATLSELVADFSRELAQAVHQATSGQNSSSNK